MSTRLTCCIGNVLRSRTCTSVDILYLYALMCPLATIAPLMLLSG